MIRTYKFKIYHSKKLKHLHHLTNVAGLVYNHCIALHKRYYKLTGKFLNSYQLQKHLTKLKKLPKYTHWRILGSQSIQDIAERINKGYKKFFDDVKKIKSGPPSFKKVKKYKSFTLKGSVGYKIEGNQLTINGRQYRFWLSRPIEGSIKTLTLKRDTLGDFYICVCLEQENVIKPNNFTSGNTVGVDFGLKTFLTLSNGEQVESPLYLFKSLDKLRKVSKKHSTKKKGSNGKEKSRKNLARVHKKITNQRRDFFHKLSKTLSDEFKYIFIENLNLSGMKKLWGRKVSDLAYAEFVNILSYKTKVRKIDKFYPSSKTCSNCGEVKKELGLDERTYECGTCGASLDRDLNAAINIHRVGTTTLTGETVRRELAPAGLVDSRIPRL